MFPFFSDRSLGSPFGPFASSVAVTTGEPQPHRDCMVALTFCSAFSPPKNFSRNYCPREPCRYTFFSPTCCGPLLLSSGHFSGALERFFPIPPDSVKALVPPIAWDGLLFSSSACPFPPSLSRGVQCCLFSVSCYSPLRTPATRREIVVFAPRRVPLPPPRYGFSMPPCFSLPPSPHFSPPIGVPFLLAQRFSSLPSRESPKGGFRERDSLPCLRLFSLSFVILLSTSPPFGSLGPRRPLSLSCLLHFRQLSFLAPLVFPVVFLFLFILRLRKIGYLMN